MIKILILSDGKPGHANQSRSIADAISLGRATDVLELTLQRGWSSVLAGILPFTLKNFTYFNVPLTMLLEKSQLNRLRAFGKPDLVVSAGGKTLAANVALTRRFEAKNVFSGSIRRFDGEHFNAVLHVLEGLKDKPNHIITLKPSPSPSLPLKPAQQPAKSIVFLVGGPIEGCTLKDATFNRIVNVLKSSHISWNVVSSRRTPESWSQILKDWASKHLDVNYLTPDAVGTGIVADVIAKTDGTLVTGDSASMISESIALQRPTISLEPDFGTVTVDQGYYKMLENQNLLARLNAGTTTWPEIKAALAGLSVLSHPGSSCPLPNPMLNGFHILYRLS